MELKFTTKEYARAMALPFQIYIASAAVKYASLLYGIKEAVGDDVSFGKLAAAGTIYSVASGIEFLTNSWPNMLE